MGTYRHFESPPVVARLGTRLGPWSAGQGNNLTIGQAYNLGMAQDRLSVALDARDLRRGDLLQPDFGVMKHRAARQVDKNGSDRPEKTSLSKCLPQRQLA